MKTILRWIKLCIITSIGLVVVGGILKVVITPETVEATSNAAENAADKISSLIPPDRPRPKKEEGALTTKQKEVVQLALEGIYEREKKAFEYVPGTLRVEPIVGDIEKWTINVKYKERKEIHEMSFDVNDKAFGIVVQLSNFRVRHNW